MFAVDGYGIGTGPGLLDAILKKDIRECATILNGGVHILTKDVKQRKIAEFEKELKHLEVAHTVVKQLYVDPYGCKWVHVRLPRKVYAIILERSISSRKSKTQVLREIVLDGLGRGA